MSSEGGRLIVVAVDPGEESIYALNWCLSNIVANVEGEGSPKDTLLLVYARPPPAIYSTLDGVGYMFSADVLASMDRYGNEVADTVMNRARRTCSKYPNVNVKSKVEIGDAREVICEAVENVNADMLVMGTHGYGLIKRTLLGSVSSYCAQNVKCPILIVKRPKQ